VLVVVVTKVMILSTLFFLKQEQESYEREKLPLLASLSSLLVAYLMSLAHRARKLVRLDVDRRDHLAPLLGVLGDQFTELLGTEH
jgi:hypothetical protein